MVEPGSDRPYRTARDQGYLAIAHSLPVTKQQDLPVNGGQLAQLSIQSIRVQGLHSRVGGRLEGLGFVEPLGCEKLRLALLFSEDVDGPMPGGLVEPGPEGAGVGNSANPPEHRQPHLLLYVSCGIRPENTLQVTEGSRAEALEEIGECAFVSCLTSQDEEVLPQSISVVLANSRHGLLPNMERRRLRVSRGRDDKNPEWFKRPRRLKDSAT
jgi:hypothetical protein